MTGWLVDKSALWKLPGSRDYSTWVERVERGQVWACLPTRLEVAVSARDPEHWPILERDLLGPLLEAHASPRSEAAAMRIMDALIAAGLHRTVPLPDVMVASIAAVEGLTVLHDDRDFERIREVYGGVELERLNV